MSEDADPAQPADPRSPRGELPPRSGAEHRALFERNPQPIIAYDSASFRIVDVNDAALRTYGHSPQELVGLSLRAPYPPEDRDSLERFLAAGLGGARGGPVTAGQCRHRRGDGTIIDVEVAGDDLEIEI